MSTAPRSSSRSRRGHRTPGRRDPASRAAAARSPRPSRPGRHRCGHRRLDGESDRRSATLTDRDSIVIGQFENTTSDPVFDETLSTALKVHLGQSPFLDLIPDQRIRETLESMDRRADARLDHAVAREVCQRLSVKAMLEGSIAALGSHYVLTLTATDCQTGEVLARTQAEATTKERRARRARRDLVVDADQARRIAAVDPAVRRADRAGDDAVADRAQGLHARARGAAARPRAGVGRVPQPGDRERSRVRLGLHDAVDGVWQPWRMAAQRGVRQAGQRRHPPRERARAAVHHLSVPRSGHRQPGPAAETLELWKAAYPRDFRHDAKQK